MRGVLRQQGIQERAGQNFSLRGPEAMKLLSIMLGLLLFSGIATAKGATARIKVTGMTCGSCVVAVKKALANTKGVKNAEVSLEKELATVVYDSEQVNEQQLRDAINKTGFKAAPAEEKK